MYRIITESINEFAIKILEPSNLKKIIDDHDNHDFNIPHFQDLLFNIYVVKREDYFQRFAKSATGGTTAMVEKSLVDQRNRQLRDEISKVQHLQTQLDSSKRLISRLAEMIKRQESKMAELRAENSRLHAAPAKTVYVDRVVEVPAKTVYAEVQPKPVASSTTQSQQLKMSDLASSTPQLKTSEPAPSTTQQPQDETVVAVDPSLDIFGDPISDETFDETPPAPVKQTRRRGPRRQKSEETQTVDDPVW